ncbi:MAG: hypothetical protein ACI8T1_004715 [Verrucomicrobiales bacterium]|jgi:hypothetical protein
MGDNESDYTLRIVQEDDKLQGVLVSSRSGEHAFSSVNMKDGTLTMEITRAYGDNELSYEYDGILSEGALSGAVAIKGAENEFSGTWAAKRKEVKAAH